MFDRFLFWFTFLCFLVVLQLSNVSSEFFDSNGLLTQVEYADKASMQGGTVIGITSGEIAILITYTNWGARNVKIPLKIHRISDYIGVSSSGITSDVNFLTNKMFEEATEQAFVFGCDPPATRLAMSIADYVHGRSLSIRYRPLGIRMCIASYDDISKASIYEIDAIGNFHRCKLSCIGKDFHEMVLLSLFFKIDDQNVNLLHFFRYNILACLISNYLPTSTFLRVFFLYLIM